MPCRTLRSFDSTPLAVIGPNQTFWSKYNFLWAWSGIKRTARLSCCFFWYFILRLLKHTQAYSTLLITHSYLPAQAVCDALTPGGGRRKMNDPQHRMRRAHFLLFRLQLFALKIQFVTSCEHNSCQCSLRTTVFIVEKSTPSQSLLHFHSVIRFDKITLNSMHARLWSLTCMLWVSC